LVRLAHWTLWGVISFSLASAADYFFKFWRQVDERIKLRRRTELLALERQRAAQVAAARKEQVAGAGKS
jgi:hypothetical protein